MPAAIGAVRQGIADRFATIPGVTAYAKVTGTPNVPAAVVELDSIDFDQTMGRGADGLVFVVTVLVALADLDSGQDALDDLLGGSGPGTAKGAMEADKTLGGLVSFAVLTTTRQIGLIPYAGVDYLGAELTVEVTA